MHTPDTSDRELITTRIINAPRSLVWRMWTKAEHLEKWYGPDGFTITTHALDFRVGGRWDFIMHGPDGRDYTNHIVYTDIVEPERIAHDHGDGADISFKALVTFDEQGDQTLLTLKSVFPTAESLECVVRENGAVEGAKQTLGRLAEYVETMK